VLSLSFAFWGNWEFFGVQAYYNIRIIIIIINFFNILQGWQNATMST